MYVLRYRKLDKEPCIPPPLDTVTISDPGFPLPVTHSLLLISPVSPHVLSFLFLSSYSSSLSLPPLPIPIHPSSPFHPIKHPLDIRI